MLQDEDRLAPVSESAISRTFDTQLTSLGLAALLAPSRASSFDSSAGVSYSTFPLSTFPLLAAVVKVANVCLTPSDTSGNGLLLMLEGDPRGKDLVLIF